MIGDCKWTDLLDSKSRAEIKDLKNIMTTRIVDEITIKLWKNLFEPEGDNSRN